MMYPASKLKTAPTTILGVAGTALLTMQNVRDALGKADDVTDDRRLASLANAAYYGVEQKMNTAIITQTRSLFMRSWNSSKILLDYPPLASVTHVKYYNTANTLTTLTAGVDYQVDTDSYRGVVNLMESKSWPDLYDRSDAVQIEYVCGKAVGSIPGEDVIREAILQELWGLFFKDDTALEVERLIHPYKVLAH